MAYFTLTELINRTIVRLRMVAGPSTQLYAEDAIAHMLEETYEMVRLQRWWDHLMSWQSQQLTGTNGLIVGTIVGAREGFHDVQHIFHGNSNQPLPIASADLNPHRLVGTVPRFVEPLRTVDDPTNNKLFRIWPMTAVVTAALPLRIRVRLDPANIFTTPSVVVPFDATCLINGAAFKYAADDGANPAQVASLQAAFEARLRQLQHQHDSTVIQLDPRLNVQTQWREEM